MSTVDYKDLYEQACEQIDVLNAVIEKNADERLYGFFYTSSIYESASELVSLHRTKRGAVKAMIAHQYAAWVEANKQRRRWTKKEVKRFEAEDPETRGYWNRKDAFWRKAYIHCASYVKEVEVKP